MDTSISAVPVQVKVKIEDEFRRFNVNPPTLATLRSLIANVVGNDSFLVRYTDSDGDLISCTTEDEFELAKELVPAGGVLRCTVISTVKDAKKSEKKQKKQEKKAEKKAAKKQKTEVDSASESSSSESAVESDSDVVDSSSGGSDKVQELNRLREELKRLKELAANSKEKMKALKKQQKEHKKDKDQKDKKKDKVKEHKQKDKEDRKKSKHREEGSTSESEEESTESSTCSSSSSAELSAKARLAELKRNRKEIIKAARDAVRQAKLEARDAKLKFDQEMAAYKNALKEKREFDSRFVAHVTYPEPAKVAPNTEIQKTFKLRNTGASAWPASVKLILVSRFNNALNSPDRVDIGRQVLPGEEVNVTVPLRTPDSAGVYDAFFRLALASGKRFGQRVRCRLQVETAEPKPAAAPEGSPSPSSSTPPAAESPGIACPDSPTPSAPNMATEEGFA